jgi:broad specificity phosphatase PhoE/ribonuclease HI
MTSDLRVVVEADGGARGNPGPAGWGAVVREADTGEVLLERAESIGRATNNVAEYRGLIAGLQAAADLRASAVEVKMDSKLVIEQMTGRWKIKHPGLRPLAAEAAALVRRFDEVRWKWVPRERNKAADRLANQAMDAAAGGGGRTVAAASAPAVTTAPVAPHRRGSWELVGTPTRLILVRHGETILNTQGRYSGRHDVPLSPFGERQAEATAHRVAGLAPAVAAVVSSPLQRCTTTAAAIAATTGVPPVVAEDDLIECDFGEWEGLTFAEVRAQWPDELDAWLTTTSAAPPGGESLQQVAKRVRRAVSGLRDSYPGEPVVVVSHVWPLKLMLRDALAAGDAFLHRLLLSPAGVSVVDSYEDGTIAVPTVNDTSHVAAAGR